MTLLDVFVCCCFLVGLGSAALVALHPNILYAAVSLIFSLLSVAGLYGALGADFLAGAQLIIYVGGIIVVILFAVMMSENVYRTRFLETARSFIMPSIASFVILVALLELIKKTNWITVEKLVHNPTTRNLGEALVGPYALPFQYVSIVLLSGLIGAVVVARPHYDKQDGKKRSY
jgi:NADH:ubiquinone oxidoreductase subunit 6 (subunit J)